MTRIVAGSVGGRTLKVPRSGTRPTSERVREALFSSLGSMGALEDAVVLDLYAGSGALGLEAASRGAHGVTLVERAAPAAAVIRDNVRTLGFAGVTVVTADVAAFAAAPARASADLAFLDPPYDLAAADLDAVLADLTTHGHLADGAIVVVERDRRAPEPTWPAGLAALRTRRYGDTTVHLAVHEPAAATVDAP
ncbi:16S rRNA (guanine(966)-N(2))-methyltransferase RsmD [Georgenia sp. Z1491]|uniref:16S rRNA (guanine(966)-N(2))-methyltransferase RsmD n=1 Tax=Georgenia sp. Z1491 TaxID=3416707 RepID=UPI003CF9057F